jgi:hypothetical protein
MFHLSCSAQLSEQKATCRFAAYWKHFVSPCFTFHVLLNCLNKRQLVASQHIVNSSLLPYFSPRVSDHFLAKYRVFASSSCMHTCPCFLARTRLVCTSRTEITLLTLRASALFHTTLLSANAHHAAPYSRCDSLRLQFLRCGSRDPFAMSPLLLAVLAVVHASDLIPLVALLQLLAAGRFAAARDWEAEVRNQWCNPLNALLLRSAAQEKVCFCSRN